MLSANQIPGLKTLIGSLKPFTRYQFRIRAATGEVDVMWGNYSAAVEEMTGEAGRVYLLDLPFVSDERFSLIYVPYIAKFSF